MLVKPLWPVMEYVVNYDYIANVLCENKDKPQLQCNGKCYLAKQLKKAQREQDKNPFGEHPFKMETQSVVYFQSLPSIDLTFLIEAEANNNFGLYPDFQTFLLIKDISHPPERA